MEEVFFQLRSGANDL